MPDSKLADELLAGPGFEPTLAAAHARLAAVRPAAYARSRNHLDGAVTRLSPYITHGFVSLPEVLSGVLARGPLDVQHKFVYELAWREYFAHVHSHIGDGILQSLHPGVLPDSAYASEFPADIQHACTGVPAIDEAVRELMATGWLHNHARMWLASYVVHLRKVHWRAGADWMYGHLLDGDLASNHLSWQWVAGTGSHKPYLFNAENVARYAPANWHSPGTVIDQSYEDLDRLARSPSAVRGGRSPHRADPQSADAGPADWQRPDGSVLRGQRVEVIHAWSLGERPAAAPGVARVGVWATPGPSGLKWNPGRWAFVMPRMRASCDFMWAGTADELTHALRQSDACHGIADLHLPPQSAEWGLQPAPRLFAWPKRRCNSFSQYWTQVSKGLKEAGELLHAG